MEPAAAMMTSFHAGRPACRAWLIAWRISRTASEAFPGAEGMKVRHPTPLPRNMAARVWSHERYFSCWRSSCSLAATPFVPVITGAG